MPKPTPLKRAIFESGRSQRSIAKAIDMDPGHLSRVVNGLHVDEPTRARISDEIGVPTSELWPDSYGDEVAA